MSFIYYFKWSWLWPWFLFYVSLCDYYVLEGMERKITAKTTPSPCVLLHRGPKYFNNYYDKLLLQSLCSFVVLFAELLICVSALSSETRHVSYSLYRKGKKRKKKLCWLRNRLNQTTVCGWQSLDSTKSFVIQVKELEVKSASRSQGSLAERKQGLI